MKAKSKKTPKACWFCKKELDPENIPFFCGTQCAVSWAMQEAYTLDKVKAKYGLS